MTAERTPGPYYLASDGRDTFKVMAAEYGRIAFLHDPYDSVHVEADASFIVEACNAYDAHIARIAELEKALQAIGYDMRSTGYGEQAMQLAAHARAALKGQS